jgi:hypothetical protein
MRYAREMEDRVRSVMRSGNPVPRDSAAGGRHDASKKETLHWIMGQTLPGDAGRSVPPLTPAKRRDGVLPGHGRARRVVVPITAALAVVGLITGLTLASLGSAHQPSARPPAAAAAGGSSMPKFYATLSAASIGFAVDIHSSRTGRVLSHTNIGAPGSGIGIVADRTDRAFVVETALKNDSGVSLLLLRISANGRSMTRTRLPLTLQPAGTQNIVDGIAISPDGTKLAVALQIITHGDIQKPHSAIIVYPMAGGAAQTWTAPHDVALAWDPVWTSGDRRLTFLWHDQLRGNLNKFYTARTQIRVLHVAAPPRNLLGSTVIATGGGKLGFIQTFQAGPANSPIITATFRDVPSTGASGTAVVQLSSLSPTGAITKVIVRHNIAYHSRAQMITADDNCQVLGIDASGHHALAACPVFGRIDNGKFTPLPHSSGDFDAAW